MKLCSSVIISVIFHAVVLLPLSRFEGRTQELIPVVVLGVAEGDGSTSLTTGEGAGGGVEQPGSEAPLLRSVKREPAKNEAVARGVDSVDTMLASAPEALETQAMIESVGDVAIAVAEVDRNSATESPAISASAAAQTAVSGFSTGGVGTGGNGNGVGAVGGGIGLVGEGYGGGGLGGTPAYAGVSYAHTPKPEYPEQARKAGWEGTVMLGVLVNVGGKAEKVEIKGSSGYAPLDQAAVEGLKRWLFRPARYGAKAVETWVKIPVVFRLAEVKD